MFCLCVAVLLGCFECFACLWCLFVFVCVSGISRCCCIVVVWCLCIVGVPSVL